MRCSMWAARTAAPALAVALLLTTGSLAMVPTPAIPTADAAVIQQGIATWYGPGFEGSRTACGQIYRATGYTAASNTLACGSVVTITNADTGAAVTVTITDRGAFGPPIVIDLSEAAFSTIAHLDHGVVRVVIADS